MARNTILIKGDWVWEDNNVAVTYAVTPGMLVEYVSTGIQPHSTAAGAAAALFAAPQYRETGSGTSGIDDDIPAGDSCSVYAAQKGCVVNAVTAETIVRGEFVESAGDGTVALFASGVILGVARSDSDLSGSVGRVEIVII